MGLPWVRLDSNIGSHDKILRLLSDPSPKRWQAAFSYTVSFAWAGGAGTNGKVPRAALPQIHGTNATARLLVTYDLWVEDGVSGWEIVNFAERQQTKQVSDAKRAAQSHGAAVGNCRRWHQPGCDCTGEVVKSA